MPRLHYVSGRSITNGYNSITRPHPAESAFASKFYHPAHNRPEENSGSSDRANQPRMYMRGFDVECCLAHDLICIAYGSPSLQRRIPRPPRGSPFAGCHVDGFVE
jgi:hypothetical protein